MPDDSSTNATVALMLKRLPDKPLLSPRDISDAIGMVGSQGILNAIEEGKIQAAKLGRYLISHGEAVKFIKSLGV